MCLRVHVSVSIPNTSHFLFEFQSISHRHLSPVNFLMLANPIVVCRKPKIDNYNFYAKIVCFIFGFSYAFTLQGQSKSRSKCIIYSELFQRWSDSQRLESTLLRLCAIFLLIIQRPKYLIPFDGCECVYSCIYDIIILIIGFFFSFASSFHPLRLFVNLRLEWEWNEVPSFSCNVPQKCICLHGNVCLCDLPCTSNP